MKKLYLIFSLLICVLASCQQSKTTYTMTFNIDGNITTEVYDENASVNFPTAEKEAYVFVGWEYNGEIIDSFVATTNATFVAVFEDKFEVAKSYVNNYITDATKSGNFSELILPNEYQGINISWRSSNESIIDTTTGKVNPAEYKAIITLFATYTYSGKTENIRYSVTVNKLDSVVILQNVLNDYEFDSNIVDGRLNLKTDFSTFNSPIQCEWESLDNYYISNYGEILHYADSEVEVGLKLTLKLDGESVSKVYNITIPSLSEEEILALVIEKANIETFVTSDKAYLPTEFEYNYVGSWTSSKPEVLGNDGKVYLKDTHEVVDMELKLQKDGSEEVIIMNYEFDVHVKSVLPIVHANEFNDKSMVNCEVVNNRLELTSGSLEGSYESDVIETVGFEIAVASWAAVSSKNATCELLVKVRVDGVWSDYISYCPGGWGLGLQNKAYDKTLSTVKLSTDELKILNGKQGDAIMFKVVLRRTSSNNESPKLSLVSFALTSSSYVSPTYSLEDLPAYVKHDVVKLNQNKVPSIGNIICSATSSTMLLKYKGMDFSEFDSEYEHRYIAGLVKDYGNNIYGNWVYNTVGMSAFGFNSYVARLYSVAELCHHLATIGPVACSMKGQMTSDQKDYYTAGHLICIIGYKYENGVLTLISNDPNVPSVECLYSEKVFTNTWRNIIYVIE